MIRSAKAKARRHYLIAAGYCVHGKSHGPAQRGLECLRCADKRAAYKRQDNRRRSQQKRAWFEEIKARPCMDCGGRFDPVCMDFDHRPGEVKLFTIGNSAGRSQSKVAILAEIAKCDIVCANCHRIRTYRKRSHADAQRRGETTKVSASPQTSMFEGAA